jgi:hypothetical protein
VFNCSQEQWNILKFFNVSVNTLVTIFFFFYLFLFYLCSYKYKEIRVILVWLLLVLTKLPHVSCRYASPTLHFTSSLSTIPHTSYQDSIYSRYCKRLRIATQIKIQFVADEDLAFTCPMPTRACGTPMYAHVGEQLSVSRFPSTIC